MGKGNKVIEIYKYHAGGLSAGLSGGLSAGLSGGISGGISGRTFVRTFRLTFGRTFGISMICSRKQYYLTHSYFGGRLNIFCGRFQGGLNFMVALGDV